MFAPIKQLILPMRYSQIRRHNTGAQSKVGSSGGLFQFVPLCWPAWVVATPAIAFGLYAKNRYEKMQKRLETKL
jgi:hypothetical protein